MRKNKIDSVPDKELQVNQLQKSLEKEKNLPKGIQEETI